MTPTSWALPQLLAHWPCWISCTILQYALSLDARTIGGVVARQIWWWGYVTQAELLIEEFLVTSLDFQPVG